MLRSLLLGSIALLPLTAASVPKSTNVIVADRVEEDWQLVLDVPISDLSCPQITTLMMVDETGTFPTAVFNMNYRDLPAFNSGGLQAKLVMGEQTLGSSSQKTTVLQTPGETITWTQQLKISNGKLAYRVMNGQSITWGQFGNDDDLLNVSGGNAPASLTGYSPDLSVTNSGPSFGPTRVRSMILVQVRFYLNNKLVSTDTTARPVGL